ncbi:MAG: phage protein GemA/Gp16 family protein [Sodalis sp. (in: enterobacteria)]
MRETAKNSARDCTAAELARVLRCMRSQGFNHVTQTGPQAPCGSGTSGDALSKIEALLVSAGRPWGYLNGMVARMLGEKRPIEWLDDAQVHQLMQMLVMDAKRHGRS